MKTSIPMWKKIGLYCQRETHWGHNRNDDVDKENSPGSHYLRPHVYTSEVSGWAEQHVTCVHVTHGHTCCGLNCSPTSSEATLLPSYGFKCDPPTWESSWAHRCGFVHLEMPIFKATENWHLCRYNQTLQTANTNITILQMTEIAVNGQLFRRSTSVFSL